MKQIAFIGLGNMGRPMAANLIKAGYGVSLFNRSPEKAQTLLEKGAKRADTIKSALEGADAVITMVSDNAAVEEVYFGPGGILESVQPGQILIDMSTVAPAISRQIAASAQSKGVKFLDAPVSGSVKPAAEGTLVILVGGDRDVFEQALPLFQTMGKEIFHLGDNGSGSHMKLCINMLLGVTLQTVGETIMLAEKGGLSREQMLDVINVSACQSPIVKLKTPAYLAGEYPAAFALRHMAKDFGLAMDEAQKLGAVLPITAAGNETFKGAKNSGYSDWDIAGIIGHLEDLNGYEE